MADVMYQRFMANLMDKLVDLGSGGDTIKVALMATGHSASTAADNAWADVSANEMAGTGYSAGGATLAGQTVTQGVSAKFDGTDSVWTTSTFSAYYAVLYDDTLAGDDLICSFDLGGVQTVTAGTFTINWNAAGIIILG